MLGIKKYGKNFKLIAETMGTKSEAQVRTFYGTHRKKYNLDSMVKEHEAASGVTEQTPEIMKVCWRHSLYSIHSLLNSLM